MTAFLDLREELSEHGSARVREAASLVLRSVARQEPLRIRQLLLPLLTQAVYSRCLTAHAVGSWDVEGERHWLPRFTFQRTLVKKPRIKVGVFAGIHGDEPAGILGLMDFVRELDEDPELGRAFELSIYPMCNPTGFLAGTRESAAGKDLNREFWRDSAEPEVRLLEAELRARRFDGIIALHSDDGSPGFYGYARGSTLANHLLVPALIAAEDAVPRDWRNCIDGFRAVNGIIHDAYDGILSAPLEQRPQPFELILETPARAPIPAQRLAFTRALRSVLAEYRALIAYGGEL